MLDPPGVPDAVPVPGPLMPVPNGTVTEPLEPKDELAPVFEEKLPAPDALVPVLEGVVGES